MRTCDAFSSIPMIYQGHTFAHVTTAMLSWHVQNCGLNVSLEIISKTKQSFTIFHRWAHKPSVRWVPCGDLRVVWWGINESPWSVSDGCHLKTTGIWDRVFKTAHVKNILVICYSMNSHISLRVISLCGPRIWFLVHMKFAFANTYAHGLTNFGGVCYPSD